MNRSAQIQQKHKESRRRRSGPCSAQQEENQKLERKTGQSFKQEQAKLGQRQTVSESGGWWKEVQEGAGVAR